MTPPQVVVVGLGPAGPELTTPAATKALSDAPRALLRTRRHPSAADLPYDSLDHLYESATDFEQLYEEIASAVVAAAEAAGSVAYAVPGSPLVLERSVELLRRDHRIALTVVPGLSFCELAWARLAIDPVAEGVRLVDASCFAAQTAAGPGPVLVGQCWSTALLSEVKLAPDLDPPSGAVILHHLGLEDEQVIAVRWEEIDRTIDADHLTTLFVPELGSPVGSELVQLGEVIRTLRRECPWDREQTHASLVRHLLEETYETIEAIEALSDPPTAAEAEHLEEELGDLLCQVYFHATLGAEEGLFELADVARTLRSKLIGRHPHVFGDVKADSSAAVVANWERGKLAEKGRTSLMDGIPSSLPALAAAAKMERKASGAGLDWEVTGERPGIPSFEQASPDEVGDTLLAMARMAAHAGIDPEAALRRSLGRFRDRFRSVEAAAAERAEALHDLPPQVRLQLWHSVVDNHC